MDEDEDGVDGGGEEWFHPGDGVRREERRTARGRSRNTDHSSFLSVEIPGGLKLAEVCWTCSLGGEEDRGVDMAV